MKLTDRQQFGAGLVVWRMGFVPATGALQGPRKTNLRHVPRDEHPWQIVMYGLEGMPHRWFRYKTPQAALRKAAALLGVESVELTQEPARASVSGDQ